MLKKKESFFWASYSDLMTSLFFIMMVLFILVMVLLYKRMEVTENKLEEIKRIEQSTRELDKGGYFTYNKDYEKYVLNISVFFPEKESDFSFLSDETRQQLDEAGDQVVDFLRRHKDTKYLLIIEGQASRNSEKWMDRNYAYSFVRARNLMKFWLLERNKQFGDNCEIQIAGSGDGRLNLRTLWDKNNPYSSLNQRFLIHIIPKNIFKE